MKFVVLVAALAMFAANDSMRLEAQASAGAPTLRTHSSLTLVDVIAENKKADPRTLELVTSLKQEDFRIFDNGHEETIKSFDSGRGARPISLWLIVQCSDDQPIAKHSMFMRGKTHFLAPALSQLAIDDAVGVAHWCDDGEASLDVPPGHDFDGSLAKVEEILNRPPRQANIRPGELAMQRMIQAILKETQESEPQRLPVFVFLYGDGAATDGDEAGRIAKDLLETSGVVYGLNDGRWPFDPSLVKRSQTTMDASQTIHLRPDRFFFLVHYYARKTGGEVYSVRDPQQFSVALEYILTQLHLRYTIGFRPSKIDGKRHALRVELSPHASERFPAVELRFRSEYIPSPSNN
jgi:hypothetical protein